MHTLSKEQVKSVSGANFGFVYVTPEWKEAEAAFLGQVCGMVGCGLGVVLLTVNPCGGLLLAPFVLGGIGYAAGYTISTLTNANLENHSLHFFS